MGGDARSALLNMIPILQAEEAMMLVNILMAGHGAMEKRSRGKFLARLNRVQKRGKGMRSLSTLEGARALGLPIVYEEARDAPVE